MSFFPYSNPNLQGAWEQALKASGQVSFRLEFIQPVWIDPWNFVNPSIREDVVKSLSVVESQVLEGQVSIESTRTAPTRQLDLTFVDAHDQYDFGVFGNKWLSPDKMIRVWYRVYAPDAEGWLECPIFNGHLAVLEKQGNIITLSALSKDSRYLEPCLWSPTLGQNKQLWKGLRVTNAIRYILGTHGEQMYNIPSYGNRLQNNLLIRWDDVPWAVCQKIAQAANMVLYYDGYGNVRLVRSTNAVNFEITGDSLVEWPTRKLDFTNIRNVVVFKGAKGVRAVARDQSHPFDQQYIKQWKVEVMENTNVKRHDVALRIATNHLQTLRRAATSVGIVCLPLPQLEEWDTVRVRDPINYGSPNYPYGGSVNIFKIGTATIPLDYKTPMTINREYPFSYKLKRRG